MNLDHDPVHSPSHYTAGAVECIDGLEAAMTREQFIGFLRGNSMKYLWRAGRKGLTVEDLEKALWYLSREIDTHRKHEADPGPQPPEDEKLDINFGASVGSSDETSSNHPTPPPAGSAGAVIHHGGIVVNNAEPNLLAYPVAHHVAAEIAARHRA